MSNLVATPALVAAAAENLAGIRTALGDAAAAAATPTTSLVTAAADEISVAVSQLFGSYGQQFQAVSAQASAFHAEFVSLLNSGAAAYVAAEAANATPLNSAVQGLLGAVSAPSNSSLGLSATSATAAPTAVGGAYQQLFANTQANLQLISQSWSAKPAPFLNQFIANQKSYAEMTGMALRSAAQSFGAGLAALPAAYPTAFQDFAAGNFGAGLQALGKGYLNLVFTGFNYSNVPVVTLDGALGDLLPLSVIPGEIAQNMTNVLKTVTDTSITTVISLLNPSFTTGMPLTLALDALGAPIVTAQAALQSATTVMSALQAGDAAGAFGALIDAPAVITNGFLNGEATITLDLPTSLSPIAGTQSLSAAIPVGGILAPPKPVVATATVRIFPLPPVTQQIPLGGTQFGGLIPGLMGASAELAKVITPL